MTGWNLPPGVTESMIPGNRPQDLLWDQIADRTSDSDLLDFLTDHDYDVPAATIAEKDTGGFYVDGDEFSEGLDLRTRADYAAYVLTFYEDEILGDYVQSEVERLEDQEFEYDQEEDLDDLDDRDN